MPKKSLEISMVESLDKFRKDNFIERRIFAEIIEMFFFFILIIQGILNENLGLILCEIGKEISIIFSFFSDITFQMGQSLLLGSIFKLALLQ